jgi:formate-nitrite transporter family protein
LSYSDSKSTFGKAELSQSNCCPPGESVTTDNDSSHTTQTEDSAPGRETQKSPQTILAEEIEEGLIELNRSGSGLFLSGLSAGLDIGFGPFLMAVVLSMSHKGLTEPVLELLVASAYAIGFIFVILGQSALFTEQTTLATLPVIHGRASFQELGKVWAIVYGSNILGAAVFAGIAVVLGTQTQLIKPHALAEIAHGLTKYRWWVILLGGILAGWLMGLLSWLASATRDTVSLILVVWIVTGTIAYAHLPHSIAGTVEVLLGVFSGAIALEEFVTFLVWSTGGNIIGGTVFVSLLRYSHAERGGYEPDAAVVGRQSDRGTAHEEN